MTRSTPPSDRASRSTPWGAAVPCGVDSHGKPARSSLCLDSATETKPTARVAWAVLLGLAAVGLTVLSVAAITSVIDLTSPPAQDPGPRSIATPAHRSSPVIGSGKVKISTPPRTPPHLPGGEWPSGTRSTELALIATNIPPDDRDKSTAVLLDVKSDRYVQLSPGDKLGDFEVVKISLDWVQLKHAGAMSWVTYRKGERKRVHTRRHTATKSPPPRVKRRNSKDPTVTYKWILGRINLAGELEDHLSPKLTAKGLQVGRVTSGFRRIGLRVGDVVKRAGPFDVHSLEQLRNGLQKAAKHGGSGSMTVLRNGRTVKLSFNVR